MPQFQNPQHIAIIMDGNGRWANKKNLPRSAGHQAGAEPVRAAISAAKKAQIPYLTLYAFSTENWGRPEDEVKVLFDLLLKYLKSELDELKSNGVSLRIIGDTASLPLGAKTSINKAVKATCECDELILTLALSYGSRLEITKTAQLIASEILAGKYETKDINEELFAEKLWTSGTPNPDLLIRTGGDMRLSNFLLWQCAYTELYFTPVLWPDFTEDDFNAALESFKRRERRFGLSEAN